MQRRSGKRRPGPAERSGPRPTGPQKLKFSYKEQREYGTIEADIAALEGELAAVRAEQEEKASDYVALQDLQARQEELEAREFEAAAGGGMVTVKVNGRKELLSVEIKPEAVDPDDVEMLQDLVLAAVNEALREATETTEREMSKLTGGMSMPGLF